MDLYKLIELQKIDKKLMDLESVRGDLPEIVQELKENLADLTDKLAKARQNNADTQRLKRDYQMDMDALIEKLDKYKEQIYSVKTNKEYDAITAEIENLEKQIDDIELKTLELMEAEDKQVESIAQLATKTQEVQENLQVKESDLQQKLISTEAEEKKLASQRKELVSEIDYRLVSTYDRIRKGKDGIALTTIVNYNCTSCFTTIPAQTVVEVRQMNRLISCEVCGRILVFENGKHATTEKNE
ncbi:MAG: zinc ribbon domain-containing protein [Candidatus Zhuqueibacterota bacterium]